MRRPRMHVPSMLQRPAAPATRGWRLGVVKERYRKMNCTRAKTCARTQQARQLQESQAAAAALSPGTPAALAIQNEAEHQRTIAQHTPSDTRSQRSHKSSASNLHSWAQPSATTSAPCSPNERNVNPDPTVYHYCYSHGFNTTLKSDTCAKLRANNAPENQLQATHPHSTTPIGSRYVQSLHKQQ